MDSATSSTVHLDEKPRSLRRRRLISIAPGRRSRSQTLNDKAPLKVCNHDLSRKTATIFGQRTIPEPSTPHIGKEVALVARTAAFVYI